MVLQFCFGLLEARLQSVSRYLDLCFQFSLCALQFDSPLLASYRCDAFVSVLTPRNMAQFSCEKSGKGVENVQISTEVAHSSIIWAVRC